MPCPTPRPAKPAPRPVESPVKRPEPQPAAGDVNDAHCQPGSGPAAPGRSLCADAPGRAGRAAGRTARDLPAFRPPGPGPVAGPGRGGPGGVPRARPFGPQAPGQTCLDQRDPGRRHGGLRGPGPAPVRPGPAPVPALGPAAGRTAPPGPGPVRRGLDLELRPAAEADGRSVPRRRRALGLVGLGPPGCGRRVLGRIVLVVHVALGLARPVVAHPVAHRTPMPSLRRSSR